MILTKKRKMNSIVKKITKILSLLIIFQILFLGISFISWAEDSNESIIFANTFGGDSLEIGFSVQETSDGGYIIVGQTYSYGAGSSDIWLVKTDKYGKKVWSRTYGGEDFDVGEHIQETSDGGYIIVGFTESFGNGERDVLLIKTDNHGDLQWDKTFGGEGDDRGRYVQEHPDGGYIISVQSEKNGLVQIKTDNMGNLEWEKEIEYYSYQKTTDGGYIVIENERDYVMLMKFDSSGNESWNNSYHIMDYDKGEWVQETVDGGYIIVGSTEFTRRAEDEDDGGSNYISENDIWLIKTDNRGKEEWRKTYGGKRNDWGNFVQQTSDGGYIIVGCSDSFSEDGNDDILLIKTDSFGNTKLPSLKEDSNEINLWNKGKLIFSISLLIITGVMYMYDRKTESKKPSEIKQNQHLEKNN